MVSRRLLKMANNFKKIHDQFDVKLSFRLSKEDYDWLVFYLDHNNLTLSQFLRSFIHSFRCLNTDNNKEV